MVTGSACTYIIESWTTLLSAFGFVCWFHINQPNERALIVTASILYFAIKPIARHSVFTKISQPLSSYFRFLFCCYYGTLLFRHAILSPSYFSVRSVARNEVQNGVRSIRSVRQETAVSSYHATLDSRRVRHGLLRREDLRYVVLVPSPTATLRR